MPKLTLEILKDRTALGGPGGDCWEWTGPRTKQGYGSVAHNGRTQRAHRVAMEISGSVPGKMLVCHRCDNPPCINPDHLFLGTHADNTHDMQAKGREKHALGSDHGSAKLTEEQVLDIRSRRLSRLKFAALYGVTYVTCMHIQNGQTWQHLSPASSGKPLSRTLTLPMKDVYFDQIKASLKPLEYRLTTPYWTKRLVGRTYDKLVLTRRYPAGGGVLGETRLEMPWRGYSVQTITHEHFGPDPVEVFAIVVSAALATAGEA